MSPGRRPSEPIPALVAMVHLPPLPGSPLFEGSMQSVVDDAIDRARILTDAGFGALMVENFGDAPFFPDHVPPITISALTECVSSVRAATLLPVGVNVLRNDASAAISIAAVTGAKFIRVNVLTGLMNTDQGPIVGRAAEVLRQRSALGATDVAIWADVFVKHAAPPAGITIEEAASDTFERGGADALVLSGPRTGLPAATRAIEVVRSTVPDAPIVVGSGASVETLVDLAGLADHVIVGTALETDGRPGTPLDPSRVKRFIAAADGAGLL